ncbi:MAG: GNAT family N-acetyltransferase [Flavobacteriales bacterium]|nr:GNAT family N-acetyltransferase [Flavobacteriales bacterium]MCL4280662.1 GNAT family N-acetyltransferase [Flavobacteriales bacterium]
MNVTIRKAEPRDVPRMLELVLELATFEKEPDAVTVTEAHMLDAGFGKQPVWWGWVAVDEAERILGIAICYERYSTWRGRVGYLEDIVVSEAARGHGIGEQLFKACAKECVRRGYHHLTWQVLDWNDGAIRFYERLGADLDGQWLNGRLSAAQLQRTAEGA